MLESISVVSDSKWASLWNQSRLQSLTVYMQMWSEGYYDHETELFLVWDPFSNWLWPNRLRVWSQRQVSGFWLNGPSCFCEIWICHVVTIIAIQFLKHFTVTIFQVTVQLWLNGKWSKKRKNYSKHMWVYTVNLQWQSPKIYSFTLSKEVEQ